MAAFRSEQQMQDQLLAFLEEEFQEEDVLIHSEMPGLFGIPDIVLAERVGSEIKHLIAIELKLSSWQRAIKQAFKYQSFAWESYVVMDSDSRANVCANLNMFKKFNVGLGTYSPSGEFRILLRPKIREPYSKQLLHKACLTLDAETLPAKKPNRKNGLGKAFIKLGVRTLPGADGCYIADER